MLSVVYLSLLLAHARAHDVSATPAATTTTSNDTALRSSASPVTSVISLFLPMGGPDQMQASVISASPNQTAFALGCTNKNATSACGFNPPVTVTEGESTLVWTNTHPGQEDVSATIPHVTLQCEMVGAHTTESPIHGATSAVCTGRSTIPGLGVAAVTSTLASTQIAYIPVTLTAGLEKLAEASRSAASASASISTTNAAAPAATAVVKTGLAGIVAMAALCVL